MPAKTTQWRLSKKAATAAGKRPENSNNKSRSHTRLRPPKKTQKKAGSAAGVAAEQVARNQHKKMLIVDFWQFFCIWLFELYFGHTLVEYMQMCASPAFSLAVLPRTPLPTLFSPVYCINAFRSSPTCQLIDKQWWLLMRRQAGSGVKLILREKCVKFRPVGLDSSNNIIQPASR